MRLLVYAQLKGIHRDARLVKHLQENPEGAESLGLNGIPDRTTIGRWRKRLSRVFETAFQKLSEYVQMLVPTEDLIVDSTPPKIQKRLERINRSYLKIPPALLLSLHTLFWVNLRENIKMNIH